MRVSDETVGSIANVPELADAEDIENTALDLLDARAELAAKDKALRDTRVEQERLRNELRSSERRFMAIMNSKGLPERVKDIAIEGFSDASLALAPVDVRTGGNDAANK